MNETEIIFIKAEDIKNICQWNNIKNDVEILTEIFIKNKEDNVYILDKENVKGLVSIGDLIRYYEDRKKVLNTNFTFLQECNYEEATKIFDHKLNVFEIPIIENGKLRGVFKRNAGKRTEFERRNLINYLKIIKEKIPRTYSLIEELNRWKKQTEGIDLYLFQNVLLSEKVVDKKELESWQNRVNREDYNKHEDGLNRGFCLESEHLTYYYKDGFYFKKDYYSKDMSVINNHRIVPNRITNAKNKIFLFGPCTVFGAYVNDYETIEYYLQKKINQENFSYEVINCGLLGPDEEFNGLFYEKMCSGDKVILVLSNYDMEEIISNFSSEYKGDLSEVFRFLDNPTDNVLDCAAHCNGNVNSKIAEVIWENIKENLLYKSNLVAERKRIQNYYISYKVYEYFDKYIQENNLSKKENSVVGSVVMNCNPFTLGHRYLIEKASKEVDYLYVFVVEEDKSYFKFTDRFQMVKEGTKDIKNVKVIPSGKYIISKETFSQYFEKDVVETVNDMEYDVRIFGEVVAPKLGISIRFVGEEPTDIVTRKYNETMKKILSEYGVNVIEYARKEINGGEVISASKVRKYLETGELDKLDELIPKSTKLLLNT